MIIRQSIIIHFLKNFIKNNLYQIREYDLFTFFFGKKKKKQRKVKRSSTRKYLVR